MALSVSDLVIPGAIVAALFIAVLLYIFLRLRSRLAAVKGGDGKNGGAASSDATAEGRDKKKLRELELKRQAFVVERYVQDGVQDHAFFRRKQSYAEEEERYRGSNNMFYVDPDAAKQSQMRGGGGGKGQETSLALVFGFSDLDGTSVCEDEATRAKQVLEKLGYLVCCFSHDGRSAAPTTTSIAKTLKHLQLCRRQWQSVVVYICGAGRAVKIPSVASLGIQLESDIGKKIAAKEQVVPTMWEMLVDANSVNNSSNGNGAAWIDLTTLLFRVRQVTRTAQPVAVFLDIAISPPTPPASGDASNDSGTNKKSDDAQKAAIVRASFETVSEGDDKSGGRDEIQSILPPQLLQQLEIVYVRGRQRPPPGAPTKRSFFNQAFVRGLSAGGVDETDGAADGKKGKKKSAAAVAAEQLAAAMLGGAGGGALAGIRGGLGSPTCGLEADARQCGAITCETIAAFAERSIRLQLRHATASASGAASAAAPANGGAACPADDADEEVEQQGAQSASATAKHVIHISPFPGSCELHLAPVYGPRCGFRPDLLLGEAHRRTQERADQLWDILCRRFRIGEGAGANAVVSTAVVRGFATTTTLKYLTWHRDVLAAFPDSVVYVDVANYAPRHATPHDGTAASEAMWRTALQVVSNTYISYNRTWPRIHEAANTVEAALVAASGDGAAVNGAPREFLLVIDNVPDFQAAAASGIVGERDAAAIADSGRLVHPAVYRLQERLLQLHKIRLLVVVGASASSFMPTLVASPVASRPAQHGHVPWMMNVAPVSAPQPDRKNPSRAAFAVELSEQGTATVAAPALALPAAGNAEAADKKNPDGGAFASAPSAWQVCAVAAGRFEHFFASGGASSSSTSSLTAIEKRLPNTVSPLLSLDLAHRNLLELVHFMQRDMQHYPVPVELVSHYAELHGAKSIDAACRSTGLSLLAQRGLVRRTALIQPRGLETECVFVNPAVRRFLGGSANAADDSTAIAASAAQKSTRSHTQSEDESSKQESTGTAGGAMMIQPIKLPRSTIEGHVWRAAVVFAQIPQLKDPEQMPVVTGAALFHETARSYFPRFLISIAALSAASHDTLRSFPAAAELGITPERCDVVLQAFLAAPQVYGDMVATMGVAATAAAVESSAAITAGHSTGGDAMDGTRAAAHASKQLRQAAAAKIVTTLRTIGDFLDNNPHEWGFQLCHRGIRGFYTMNGYFARVPATLRGAMRNPGSMSGLAVPVITCSNTVNGGKNYHGSRYATVLLGGESRASRNGNDEQKKQQQRQQQVRYPTAIEYAPFNVHPPELRGLLVVGYSDGSVAVFRPAPAGDATASEVAEWPEAMAEAPSEKAHGVGNAVTNILFEIDEQDLQAEEREAAKKKKKKDDKKKNDGGGSTDDAESSSSESGEDDDDQKKKEETGAAKEDAAPRAFTRIITASRNNGVIYRWTFHLKNRESLARLDPKANKNVIRCAAPYYARIMRFCTDEERLAHERLGFLGRNPATEEEAESSEQDNKDGTPASSSVAASTAALDACYRRTTHTTFESGGEIVALMSGQEHDGDRNQVLLTLTEVRQCVVSMTFDTEPITKPSEWRDDGLITAATVGVDAALGCVVVCVGDRTGRLMQFELRFYYDREAEEERAAEAAAREKEAKRREQAAAAAEAKKRQILAQKLQQREASTAKPSAAAAAAASESKVEGLE